MRKIVLVLSIIIPVLAAGCASDQGIDDTPDYGDEPLTDRHGENLESADAKRLYESARDLFMHDKASQALPLYRTVTARFPFSKYAPQSALERIAAQYVTGEYDKTVDEADRFIKSYPQNSNIDYVYYMRGLANYARNDPGMLATDPDKRNVDYLKQAFNDFNILLKNYPDSDYRNDARQRMVDIRNRVARSELDIAEYYYRRRAYVAAARRAEGVVKNLQGSDSIPRALEIMEQSYANLNLADLAEDTRAVLQASYPNYILHREEFYRQNAGEDANYELPDMGDDSISKGEAISEDDEDSDDASDEDDDSEADESDTEDSTDASDDDDVDEILDQPGGEIDTSDDDDVDEILDQPGGEIED